MATDRLSLALDLGVVDLPRSGAIAVFVDEEAELPANLPKDRLRVIAPWRPVLDRLDRAGFSVAAELSERVAASIVQLPRSRSAAQIAIAQAMAATEPSGPVVIDGQKTGGIDPILRDVQARVPVVDSYVKFHGRLFWVAADPSACAAWMEPAASRPPRGGYHTAPGAFSEEGPDRASVALAEALPAQLPASIADLGAGWGYLSAQILKRTGVERVELVEAHHGALAAASRNITDPRAQFHWADATVWAPQAPVEAVVMNPPFHIGRAADPALGQSFIATAARVLTRAGHLWLVANRQLPYEAALQERFAQVASLPAPPGFKILHAQAPRPTAAPAKPMRESPRDLFR